MHRSRKKYPKNNAKVYVTMCFTSENPAAIEKNVTGLFGLCVSLWSLIYHYLTISSLLNCGQCWQLISESFIL